MKTFTVPVKEDVSPLNQELFDNLKSGLGFIPNLYATFAHSQNALATYLTLQNSKSSLSAKEREIINLVTSQINDCKYCLSAHTAIGKMNGFSDEQLLEIRNAEVTFNQKFDALAKLTKSIVEKRGKPESDTVNVFFESGYTNENLIDAIMIIGDKTISNYLHGTTRIPIDFPLAPELQNV